MTEYKNEENQKLTVSCATDKDSGDIWIWRNDEETREMSITEDMVTWGRHLQWYKECLNNKNRYLYIGYLNGIEKIGVCRFDVDEDKKTAEVSINLNPLYRGKKLSAKFLAESMHVFTKEENVTLTATIKKINLKSIKCFEKIGFVFDADDGEFNYYKYRP